VHDRTDAELVAACRKGEIEAYSALVRRHSRQVFAICLGMTGRISDSEDLAQEILVKGFQEIGGLRDGKRFAAWIAQIARNRCYDFLRVQGRRRDLLQREATRAADEVEPEEPDHTELHIALERLPEEYRLPLMLYYFDGQSAESVARALEMSPAGAYTRLSRARRELRRLLEEGA